jgi:hypothetical protein
MAVARLHPAVAEKNDDRCHEAELHRLKGELLLQGHRILFY